MQLQPDFDSMSGGSGRRHEPAPGDAPRAFAPPEVDLDRDGLLPGVHAVPSGVGARVREILGRSGALAALQFLNARTRFRFTGIYRAEPPNLRNIFLTDRENPTLNVSGRVCPLDDTYCGITCAGELAFMTPDAQQDRRLIGHPARDSVLSYAGMPLRLPGVKTWGTLCHFDLRPRLLPASELAVLKEAAPLFVDWLRVHGTLA